MSVGSRQPHINADYPSASDLAARLAQCRADWLPRYFPAGKLHAGVFYLGSADGDAGRSLPIPLRATKAGLVDFAGGFAGDDLDLLARAIRGDSKTAFREAVTYLGLVRGTTPTRPPPRKPPPKAEPESDEASRAATRLWRSSLPISPSDVAGRYMLGRGCALPHVDGDLRWAPKVHHAWSGRSLPALLALVTDPVTAKPVSLHRTWLADDGSSKATVNPVRAAWQGLPLGGGVCRLWPDDEVTLGLGLGEGLESTLAMANGFTPAWASLTAGNMARLPVLTGIACLTIGLDWDRLKKGRSAGKDAAAACGRRWLAAGCQVRIWPPDCEGQDLADHAEAIRAEIHQGMAP